MIENHLISKFHCSEQNTDTLELIECICSNTIVLDLRAVNNNYVTHVIIDEETALTLSNCLKKWLERGKQ